MTHRKAFHPTMPLRVQSIEGRPDSAGRLQGTHQVILLRGQEAAQHFAVRLLAQLAQALEHIARRHDGQQTRVLGPLQYICADFSADHLQHEHGGL